MRYRLTVRGDGAELRGYVTLPHQDALDALAGVLRPVGIVMASEAEHDYNPFVEKPITEPDFPPSLDQSIAVLQRIWEESSSYGAISEDFLHRAGMIHFGQALVIRQERYLREKGEAEQRDRELHHFEVEQENARLKQILDGIDRAIRPYITEFKDDNAASR